MHVKTKTMQKQAERPKAAYQSCFDEKQADNKLYIAKKKKLLDKNASWAITLLTFLKPGTFLLVFKIIFQSGRPTFFVW